MAFQTQAPANGLIKSAVKARALARAKGDHTNAWLIGLADEMEAGGVDATTLLEAADDFERRREELVRQATTARAQAQADGDPTLAWLNAFAEEAWYEFGISRVQLADAVQLFDDNHNIEAVIERLRETGIALTSPGEA